MIASRDNETVKAIRRLRRSKGDQAILEGPHLVREAIAQGLALDPVLVSPRFLASEAGAEVSRALERAPKLVSEEILEGLSDADAPRGVLAVARLPRPALGALKFVPHSVWLYLDGIQDPGNVGALARVAEGLGATGLLLSPGCADPNHSRSLRGSAGSLLRLPVTTGVAPEDARRWSAGATWIGLDAHAGARSWREIDVDPPFVLALGAEGPGLSDTTRGLLDRSVTIPLGGRLESLNVAVAAALVLAELLRTSPR